MNVSPNPSPTLSEKKAAELALLLRAAPAFAGLSAYDDYGTTYGYPASRPVYVGRSICDDLET